MPNPEDRFDVVGLQDPEGGQLHVDPQTGRAMFKFDQAPPQGASLAGPMPNFGRGTYEGEYGHNEGPVPIARRYGMGGSTKPAPQQYAQRTPTPDELKALADAMTLALQNQQSGPSAVEPVLEKEMQAPWWLRNYMDRPENKPEPQKEKTSAERIDSTDMAPEEKEKYKRYAALKPSQRK